MLIEPDVKDEEIIACLRDAYGLDIATVSFLPLGADFNTAVYCVTTTTQTDYFLKLRSGEFLEASVSVPKYLADLGIKQVIPPIATKTGQNWHHSRQFCTLILKAVMALTPNYQKITGLNLVRPLKSFMSSIFLHQ